MDTDATSILRNLSLALVPFVLSLSVHEFAHARVAYALGDTTAKDQGRLTLNPLAHADLWGTIIIPTALVLSGGGAFFAWAKPVPTRPDRFRKGINRRLGSALVAVAGPLSNVALAILSAGLFALLRRGQASHTFVGSEMHLTPLAELLASMVNRNIGLAVFNLLPIPPLDGHYLLPPFFDPIVRPMARYGFAALMFVTMLKPGLLGAILYPPMRLLASAVAGLFGLG